MKPLDHDHGRKKIEMLDRRIDKIETVTSGDIVRVPGRLVLITGLVKIETVTPGDIVRVPGRLVLITGLVTPRTLTYRDRVCPVVDIRGIDIHAQVEVRMTAVPDQQVTIWR